LYRCGGLLLLTTITAFTITALSPAAAQAQVTPGTGLRLFYDDFEDEKWEFVHNFPKSSEEQDGQRRFQAGFSNNGKWGEGLKRGQPDLIQRVATPPGGPSGSAGSMLMRTRDSGIPGRVRYQSQQDDLVLNSSSHVGTIPVWRTPSVVARVYLPPFDQWDAKTGTTFGFRADVTTTKEETETKKFLFIKRKKVVKETELYWPGMFIQFNSKADSRYGFDSAIFLIRGDQTGQDVVGPQIHQVGWWTLGMSFTPDGRVHYYASPGVDPLNAEDCIGSHFAYSYQCEQFNTAFFNVCSRDDGHTWSTPWIVDDVAVYALRR
jgi:hypothetical protein